MDLKDIKGIGPKAQELLEAAGYTDIETLAHANPAVLGAELAKANQLLHVARQDVSSEKVNAWIAAARELIAPPKPAADDPGPVPREQMPVDYEQSPEVLEMLATSPFALPLPAKVLMENQVSVSQIPAGIMLNNYVGDLDVRVGQLDAQQASPHASVGQAQQHPQSAAVARHDLLRTARESTNRGRDPKSRWYVRGVLHSNPLTIYFAAIVSTLTVFLMPASILSAMLLVLSREIPETFSWVPSWLLWVPASVLVIGPAYLIFGLSGRCRICNQRLFVHRSHHHKNNKAHHVTGLGYVLPLCLHMLVFKWFRCTHCGTAVRVKE